MKYNARSHIAIGQEFKGFIEDLSDKPDIGSIHETWLKPVLDFVIKGYISLRRDIEQREMVEGVLFL